ncbi:hypothetical protein ASPZODRAFT_86279 [Penicilliopsis zonata CBS 506.65]|uniref:Dicer-like protein 2 n=1 Tax=Penicilliopsis zonata CBS 506.65 TaxID=1073090 RepID=A0A1L9SU35_9EURO|nr:hypothetical protein ASPZODRAFT_86279 [Penicilliopsis zonata CBS 506.65]OJJ50718.1 hypothetical protein ASPZODRAFT_86279 [Penicilliopsis zonata CBS 506.65]
MSWPKRSLENTDRNRAVLRILAELERSLPDRMIWFLAPTVALCNQQHDVLAAHLPVKIRLLTGADNVDRWTEQAVWDAVLDGVRVVVSTFAVLTDAMGHGFVKTGQLALLIFDEAHHCTKRSPANKIMQDFYHPARLKYGSDAVPRILGLSASPVLRSNPADLRIIESNLHAVCRTPRMHRAELARYTHRPRLHRVWFKRTEDSDLTQANETLRALLHAWETLEEGYDPSVKQMKGFDELKRFVDRSRHVFDELGDWAAEYFIQSSIAQFRARFRDACMSQDGSPDDEATSIATFLSRIPSSSSSSSSSSPSILDLSVEQDLLPVCSKMESLIAFLNHSYTPDFSGLIFVTRRATVAVMATILALDPRTRDRFRCAPCVGWASTGSTGGKKDSLLDELLDIQTQRDTLADFRAGRKNLLVATSVLEEGIDVSACSLVICYDKPANLKSFVQRRGRARQQRSTFVLMTEIDDPSPELRRFTDLERIMIQTYQDDQRRLEEARGIEALDEAMPDTLRLRVESTGALLTADTAIAHLHHFCAVLPHEPYADTRPVFSFTAAMGMADDETALLNGTVILPNCVDPAIRRATGSGWWRTERAAMKDAAFQAYKALYIAGLVNEHLLPLTKKRELRSSGGGGGGDDDDTTDHDSHEESLPSTLEVSGQLDPWVGLAHAWSAPDIHRSLVTIRKKPVIDGPATEDMSLILTTPLAMPSVEPLTLYWDAESTFEVSIETDAQQEPPVAAPAVGGSMLSADEVTTLREITAVYIHAPHSNPPYTENDFVALFHPQMPTDQLPAWLHSVQGRRPAVEAYRLSLHPQSMGLVRDKVRYDAPHVFKQWHVDMDDASLEVECYKLSPRRNLLHPLPPFSPLPPSSPRSSSSPPPSSSSSSSPDVEDTCTVDRLPADQALIGLFIPAVLDQLEAALLATRLRRTVLRDIPFATNRHILTAITAPSAQTRTHYQRYEFFGDSVLKFAVSSHLFVRQPTWHEGYLSEGRDAIVKNNRLTRVALRTGLDAFIITKAFTPRKWRAPLISRCINPPDNDAVAVPPSKRSMSAKVLADVVEALIGAAYFEGGHDMARLCIHTFLPEVPTTRADFSRHRNKKGSNTTMTPMPRNHLLTPELKEHIGYTFRDESLLLEALTHPSCEYDETTQSYQRLEFLGDAVLDMVVAGVLARHGGAYSPHEMTTIKHALVNANLLAFFCMEFARGPTPANAASTTTTETISLWRFMRSQGTDLRVSRDACLLRHAELRASILAALHSGNMYPWEPLARLNADKFFSDLIESMIGAIFVDSEGDLAVCEAFIARLGLLDYLARILNAADPVGVIHPRAIVQKLAKSQSVQYLVQRVERKAGTVVAATYTCRVLLGGEQVVFVDGCGSSEEAEVRAANLAMASF